MLCLMSYITPKITSNNHVPCGVVFFVEFLFNVGGNILTKKREQEREHKKDDGRQWNLLLLLVSFQAMHFLLNLQPTWFCHKKSYLFNIVFRQSLRRDINSILLHFLAHVGILNYCFSLFRHCRCCECCLLSSSPKGNENVIILSKNDSRKKLFKNFGYSDWLRRGDKAVHLR